MDKVIKLCDMKFYQGVLLIFMITLASCTETYRIQLIGDEGAVVSQPYPFDKTAISRYANSDVISNLDTSGYSMTYRIQKIDSLGQYLNLLNPELIKFSIKKDTLTIRFSNEYPFTEENAEGFKVYFRFTFDRKVKKIISDDLKPKVKGDYSVEFSESKRQMVELNRRPTEMHIILN